MWLDLLGLLTWLVKSCINHHLAGKKLHQCSQICHRFLGISEEQALRSD